MQSTRVHSNDPTVGELTIPILNDCVHGCTSVPLEAVVAQLPKACLPPVVQSPSDPFNDPNVDLLSIVSLDARASGCTSFTVRSRLCNAHECAHVIFFKCQLTSVHTEQDNANASLVLLGPESNDAFSLGSSNDGTTNAHNQPVHKS